MNYITPKSQELKSKEEISTRFRQLQEFICRELERIDGLAKFSVDDWIRPEGGGGTTRVLKNGAIIEKGGVAFSAVHGVVSDQMKKQLLLDGEDFFATGVSIVLHPESPHIPIIHMNVRYFETDDAFWFGGGIDLTPHIVIPEHASLFHQDLKVISDRFDPQFYPKFKQQADDYFFIPHRNETRGIGGIFFDHENSDKDLLFDYCIALGEAFPRIYEEQIKLGKNKSITDDDKLWQYLRRGRYVEFNLVNDRGTKFGLFSGGRTESILMSLPPQARWEYVFDYENFSSEKGTMRYLTKGIDWLQMKY